MSPVCDLDLLYTPPEFLCSDDERSVSYTLVCNHRKDCSDQSDEDFCVYPECDPVTQFDCANGQVSVKCVISDVCVMCHVKLVYCVIYG